MHRDAHGRQSSGQLAEEDRRRQSAWTSGVLRSGRLRSMPAPADYIAILEACYAPTLDRRAWAQAFLRALHAVVGSDDCLGIVLAREHEQAVTVELSEFLSLPPLPGLE